MFTNVEIDNSAQQSTSLLSFKQFENVSLLAVYMYIPLLVKVSMVWFCNKGLTTKT